MSEEPKDKPNDDDMFGGMMRALGNAKDPSHYEKETGVILMQSAMNYINLLSFSLILRTVPSDVRKSILDEEHRLMEEKRHGSGSRGSATG